MMGLILLFLLFYAYNIFNKSLSMAKAKAFRLFLVFFRAEEDYK